MKSKFGYTNWWQFFTQVTIIVVVVAIVVAIFVGGIQPLEEDSNSTDIATSEYCYDNLTYIKFEPADGSTAWGAIKFDADGKTIACKMEE